MKDFIGKIFSGSDDEKGTDDEVVEFVGRTLDAVVETADLELSFDLESDGDHNLIIDFCGADEGLLTRREGQLLDDLQLFLKRATQRQFTDVSVRILVDCNGFRERADDSLRKLADKLKGVALKKGKPAYVRALPPRDRKIIHQHLSEDDRVQSRSIGDGVFKKIQISLKGD